MKAVTQKISGKKLSKVIKIPAGMKDIDLEITIRPARVKNGKYARLYASPIKVSRIEIPVREKRNER